MNAGTATSTILPVATGLAPKSPAIIDEARQRSVIVGAIAKLQESYLDPAMAVFEAMLEGWATQQRARLLKAHTVEPRVRLVRRFAAFSN